MIKDNNRTKKYFNSLSYRTFISLVLLIISVMLTNIPLCSSFKKNFLNHGVILLKVPFYVSNLIPNNDLINDTLVSNSLNYDQIDYIDNNNIIINYSFGGVYNLTDGIVVDIKQKENNLYSIIIQDVEGYLYEYDNLKSVDLNIYTFVKSQTIIGASQYDEYHCYYKYDLKISKDGEFYDFFKVAKGQN